MTLYERLQQKGRTEGRLEGEARGRVEGEARGRAAALLKLITLKFSAPSAETTVRVQEATEAELDTWLERILTVSTQDELFAS